MDQQTYFHYFKLLIQNMPAWVFSHLNQLILRHFYRNVQRGSPASYLQ
jgi:hypothetical protein